MTKIELRKEFIKRRDAIPEFKRRQYSQLIADIITDSHFYKSFDTVLSFVSIGSEVDTSEIINRALSNGKNVGVPYIENGIMSFKRINSTSDLIKGRFGIPTAPAGSPQIVNFENCLCIAPCLSADKDGYRLGYGGGYYDRFLAVNKNIFSVAVCFDELISESLPRDKFDVKVSMVITERKETGV